MPLFPAEKIAHILFNGTNTGYGLTIYSVLADDKKTINYAYSIFNPRDKQFKKHIGRAVAYQHYQEGNFVTLNLDNPITANLTARNINFLICWDITRRIKQKEVEHYKLTKQQHFIPSRLLRNLRDYMFNKFLDLHSFQN